MELFIPAAVYLYFRTSTDKMSFIEFGQDGKITGFHLNQPIEIRRLSTLTKVRKSDNCKFYTEWKWYWKENYSKYSEYDVKVTLFCSANRYRPFYFTITILHHEIKYTQK